MDKAHEDAHADVDQSQHAVVNKIFNCDYYSIYVNMH